MWSSVDFHLKGIRPFYVGLYISHILSTLFMTKTVTTTPYYVVLSSGLYTVDAADLEDAAWQAFELSNELDSQLHDVVPCDLYSK